MDKRNEWKLNELPELEKKDIYKPVCLNKYGYYELRRQNTREERNANFEEHYFQDYSGVTYEKVEYPPEELKFLNNQIEERAYVIEQNLAKTGISGDYSLLDIGCGEGFLLQYFHDKGKKVKGIDIGSYALEHFHPSLLPFFEKGDMETLLPVMAERSILVIKVANNYSNLQRMLLQKGEMKEEYWLDDPDHTGYFNREGMIARLEGNGFECMDFYGDTFVDYQMVL